MTSARTSRPYGRVRSTVAHRLALVVAALDADDAVEQARGRTPCPRHRARRGRARAASLPRSSPQRVVERDVDLDARSRRSTPNTTTALIATRQNSCAVGGERGPQDVGGPQVLGYLIAPALAELRDLVGRRSPSRPAPRRCADRATPADPGSLPGVRLNRGAGAGWSRPYSFTTVLRALMCGWSTASAIVSTGAKHASVCSRISHHSSRVLVLNSAVNRSRSSG